MNSDYLSAVTYIENQTWSATRLGLGRTKELLSKLGNPEKRLKFIHVAGSNGKGSTCAMLSSILKEAGYRVGLYTSPYLVDFREQLQVDGECIKEDELVNVVNRVRPVADAMEDHPSRFEILTACGMLYFLEKNCDIVVLEVGMGGALDSTNVIPPALVSVIMNIGLEHCEYLGNTIEEIAATKAGIIKKGTKCVCYYSSKEAVDVVKSICKRLSVDIDIVDKEADISIPLMGAHQRKNAAVALCVINHLKKIGYKITDDDVSIGLNNVKWPARFQVLSNNPLFILDGAHNPQCVDALYDTLLENYKDKRFRFLIGVLADKDYRYILDKMLPLASECICVTPSNERALSAERLESAIDGRVPCIVCENINDAIKEALSKDEPVLAFGSLYMAGDLLAKFTKVAKAIQRKACLSKRADMTELERIDANSIICNKLKTIDKIQKARTIFSYLSAGDETNVRELNLWAMEMGKQVAFPVSYSGGIMEAFVPEGEESLEIGKFDIRSPKSEKSKKIDPNDIDVIIVPCVGFDGENRRIGHGGGYYDRYIPKCPNATTILVGYESQRLNEVICEETDRLMDVVVTENTIYSRIVS